jgi:uncharacterized membrane protein YjjB (DUF3815 family)
VPSEREQRDAAAYQFVAALGGAMAAANYPVTMVGETMAATSRAYGNSAAPAGDGIYIANPDFDLRDDQSFPLAKLVARAPSGTIDPGDGMSELERIRHQQRRFPVWVTVLGYAVQSTGLALILQPTPWSLVGAAILGLMVGVLSMLGLRIEAIGYLPPTICSFLVALIVFSFNERWHVGVDSLRALAAPLAGIADTNLVTIEINRLGGWAPLLGVLIYGLGAMLYFGPPTSFLPWMLLMLLTAYAGQWVGNAALGSYASGFGGGLTLILFALAISHRPNTPPTVSLVLPGFWLLVPGSLGFMGVTQLLGAHSSAVFTATLISMMSIAVGVQTGVLLWRAAIQLTSSPDRRAMHD